MNEGEKFILTGMAKFGHFDFVHGHKLHTIQQLYVLYIYANWWAHFSQKQKTKKEAKSQLSGQQQ